MSPRGADQNVDQNTAGGTVGQPVQQGEPPALEHAALLLRRYARTGDLSDVGAAIEAARVAVARAGGQRRARAAALTTLANARAAAFQEWGHHEDIASAVDAQREAVVLLEPADPDRVALQVNLADRLLALHALTRDQATLDEAVRLCDHALTRDLPSGWRLAALDCTGRALRARHAHSSDLGDLERSATVQEAALAGTPAFAPERAVRLNNMANARWTIYQATGDLRALDEAAAGYRDAAEAATYPAARVACLLGLGTAHWARWSRHRAAPDLDTALAAFTDALAQIPAGSSMTAHCRLDLGAARLARWREDRRDADLDAAIEDWTVARSVTGAEADVVEAATGNLAAALWERYETRGEKRDLSRAFALLDVGPGPAGPAPLLTLAGALRRSHGVQGDESDLADGLARYRAACEAGSASDLAVALVAGQQWGSWAAEHGRLLEADEAYTRATVAALRLYGRQGTREHVSVWLGEAAGLAARQAWVQGRLGRPDDAVRTLERGRAYLLSGALRREAPCSAGSTSPTTPIG